MKVYQTDPRSHLIRQPGDGQIFNLAGITITVKTNDAASGGTFSVYEAQIAPHFAALPPHFHRTTTEWFYMCSGTLAFTLDDETIMIRAGSFVLVAPEVVHTFWNPTATTATLLGFRSQPDFAEYLTKLSALIASTPNWPPADMNQAYALAAQYDQFQPGTA